MSADQSFSQNLNDLSFDLIRVERGAFMMGSEGKGGYNDEKPAHRVRIDRDFFIGRYPVTQALWQAVMPTENPSWFKGAQRPVERVSWYDAAVFCNALNERCGHAPVYFSDPSFRQAFGKTAGAYTLPNKGPVFRNPKASGYRLPTEAEWEYAARGGAHGTGLTYSGSEILDVSGWYDENSHGETKPVGLKLPNELGIYDMSGNVWEWCEDHWHNHYNGAPEDGSPWLDTADQGLFRVYRGGSWLNRARLCRVAYRTDFTPAGRLSSLGFRLVLFPLPV